MYSTYLHYICKYVWWAVALLRWHALNYIVWLLHIVAILASSFAQLSCILAWRDVEFFKSILMCFFVLWCLETTRTYFWYSHTSIYRNSFSFTSIFSVFFSVCTSTNVPNPDFYLTFSVCAVPFFLPGDLSWTQESSESCHRNHTGESATSYIDVIPQSKLSSIWCKASLHRIAWYGITFYNVMCFLWQDVMQRLD
jgi:hypothetical protein